MTAFVLGLPEHKVRVIAPDVGGGFGSKIYLYAEETAMVWASQARQPADQVGVRAQRGVPLRRARPRPRDARRARARQGRQVPRDARAHDREHGRVPVDVRVVHPDDPVRDAARRPVHDAGDLLRSDRVVHQHRAGRRLSRRGTAEATYVVERLVHQAAVEMNIPQDEIRRRNFIRTFPYQTPVALTYDTGDYDAHARRGDEDGRRRRASRRARRKPRSAASCAASATRRTSRRAASRRRTSRARSARARACSRRAKCACIPTGSVTVFTGSHSHGQGHETTFAQVVAARLGIAIDNVDVVHGDTGRVPFGMGTYGSRSLAVGGTAIVKALDKIIAKGKKIAAHLLEAAEARHRVQGRQVHGGRHRPQQGVRRDRAHRVRAAQLSARQARAGPRTRPRSTIRPTSPIPAGTHICEVEIDPDTGVVAGRRSSRRATTSATSSIR